MYIRLLNLYEENFNYSILIYSTEIRKSNLMSVLNKGAMATAASVGVTAFAGNAAAYSDWTVDITLNTDQSYGTYEVKVPFRDADSWVVSGTDYNESDDDLTVDDGDNEVILTGNVDDANNGFNRWMTNNTSEPYVTSKSDCKIDIY